MKTHPSAQPLGFFNLEQRSIGRQPNVAAIGLISPIYNLARCEPTSPRHRMPGLPAA